MSDQTPEEQPEWVSGKLIESLTCPASGGPLEYNRDTAELVSKRAGLAYPIRSGIPIMLIDEARQLDR
ncbi:MAG: Trm112 family protein [Pseudomonadota bacterium]